MKFSRWEAKLGKVIPLGEIDNYAGIFYYDPRQALQTVKSPGLLVYGEMDPLVPADHNLARFNEIFNGNPPHNLKTVIIPGMDHSLRVPDKMCGNSSMEEYVAASPLSEELVQVLQDWLTEQGY